MPGLLDARDRQLLIGTGLLLVLLVVAAALLGPAQVSGSATVPSSYSPAWGGAKAAFLLLGRLDYRMERWEKPTAELPAPAGPTVFVLADPAAAPSGEDRTAIREFLEAGGRVLATGPSAAPFLPDATAFTEEATWNPWQRFAALAPSPLAREVGEIEMQAPIHWHPRRLSHVTVFGNQETAAVVSWPFGRGEVIWWAAATPLTNGGIRRAGNLGLLLNSIGPAGGTRVLWDEYDHGVRETLWSFFSETPAPWILAQLGLVFVALLASYSRRHGPARMPPAASRLSPIEFVETLGDLYFAARASAVAVATAQGRLRFLLTRQLGLPANAGVEEISRGASQQLGWPEAAISGTLGRAERAAGQREMGNEEALKLVREIHEWIARMQIGHSAAREASR